MLSSVDAKSKFAEIPEAADGFNGETLFSSLGSVRGLKGKELLKGVEVVTFGVVDAAGLWFELTLGEGITLCVVNVMSGENFVLVDEGVWVADEIGHDTTVAELPAFSAFVLEQVFESEESQLELANISRLNSFNSCDNDSEG